MSPRAADVLAAAESQLGKGYRVTACRCSEVCDRRDCSGLVIFAANHEGLSLPCTSSFGLARMGRDAGRLISLEEAASTPAALAIRNGFGSPNGPNGSNGHVVFCKGDGYSTVEAMGTRYGIVRGRLADRGFETFMLLPGVDYSPPVDWAAVENIARWVELVTKRELRRGDKRPRDNAMLNFLLVVAGLCPPPARITEYTLVTAGGVRALKLEHPELDDNGDHFGRPAALALVALIAEA